MDAIGELLTVARICALKARYCRFLDTKDWNSLGALFLDDAVLDVEQDTGLAAIHGRAAIVAQIKAAVVDAATSHQVHTPEIAVTGDDSATGIWAMQDRVVWKPGKSPVSGVASITGYGQYHETYRLTPAGWMFATLRLTRFHVDRHPA